MAGNNKKAAKKQADKQKADEQKSSEKDQANEDEEKKVMKMNIPALEEHYKNADIPLLKFDADKKGTFKDLGLMYLQQNAGKSFVAAEIVYGIRNHLNSKKGKTPAISLATFIGKHIKAAGNDAKVVRSSLDNRYKRTTYAWKEGFEGHILNNENNSRKRKPQKQATKESRPSKLQKKANDAKEKEQDDDDTSDDE